MSARESCKWCTRPIATDADYESIAEGEGRHLCWSEFGNDPDCEGVDGAEDIITDLRAQLDAVTAERGALKGERYEIMAEAIARFAHWGQVRRNGAPYITHPEAVAKSVESRLRPIAWLHDVVEDTDYPIDALMAAGFPPYITTAVAALTKHGFVPYEDHVRAMLRCPDAVVVKRADIAHNLSDEPTARQREKYARALAILAPPPAIDETKGTT